MLQQMKTAVAGAQILFVAFGAMVLVPILTGLNPASALLGAGIGTLVFQLLTKRKVPIFLGSSFAFIAPIIAAKQNWGVGATMFGLFAAANPAEAKTKALNTLLLGHAQQHKDNLKDVDNLLALDRVGRHRIILTPNPHGRPSEIGFQGYLPI